MRIQTIKPGYVLFEKATKVALKQRAQHGMIFVRNRRTLEKDSIARSIESPHNVTMMPQLPGQRTRIKPPLGFREVSLHCKKSHKLG